MSATDVLLLVLTAVGLTAPRLAGRFARRADPRLTAGIALLAVADLAVLPILWLGCLGSGIPVPGLATAAACWPALASASGRHVEAGLALVLLAGLAWHTGVAARCARAAEPRGLALASCSRRRLRDGGCAWVVPAPAPVAYVAGLARPRIVVSQGLLDLLTSCEQEAVLAHEAAHLQLGHARLLVVGSALARTYRWMPGMARAWALVRREVEATADDGAARAFGATPLLSALAKVAIARNQPTVAAFNDMDAATLRYRIDRLQHPNPPAAGRSPAATVGVALAAALTWSGCALAAAHPSVVGMVACALAAGWLATRPAGGLRALWRRWRSGSTAPTART